MGAALTRREDGIIHSLLKVGCLLGIFSEEDQACSRSAQGLVAENCRLAIKF